MTRQQTVARGAAVAVLESHEPRRAAPSLADVVLESLPQHVFVDAVKGVLEGGPASEVAQTAVDGARGEVLVATVQFGIRL